MRLPTWERRASRAARSCAPRPAACASCRVAAQTECGKWHASGILLTTQGLQPGAARHARPPARRAGLPHKRNGVSGALCRIVAHKGCSQELRATPGRLRVVHNGCAEGLQPVAARCCPRKGKDSLMDRQCVSCRVWRGPFCAEGSRPWWTVMLLIKLECKEGMCMACVHLTSSQDLCMCVCAWRRERRLEGARAPATSAHAPSAPDPRPLPVPHSKALASSRPQPGQVLGRSPAGACDAMHTRTGPACPTPRPSLQPGLRPSTQKRCWRPPPPRAPSAPCSGPAALWRPAPPAVGGRNGCGWRCVG